MSQAVIGAPLVAERLALRRAATPVVRTGMGPRRSAAAADRLRGRGRLVAGVAGGLAPGIRVGDVVVATEVRGPRDERVECPSAPLLAGELRRLGRTVHMGPIRSERRVLTGAARRRTLAAAGALAVDTESVWLAPAEGEPFAVVRVISDTADAPLLGPGIVVRGSRALAVLARTVPALDAWAAATGPHDICYATTNRQAAVRASAAGADLVLVVGSADSSNSLRLVEVAESTSAPARLVEDAGQVELGWLARYRRIAVTAGASAPPRLVDDLVAALSGLGPATVVEADSEPEDMRFTLPREVT